MKVETRQDGVKEIFLEDELEVEHLLGQFITPDDYSEVIDFDCDVYKPNKKIGVDDRDESLVLVKFRKNAFDPDVLEQAYKGLEKGAAKSQNRGLAAGPRKGKLNNREWLTKMQLEILETLQSGTAVIVDEDPIEEIKEKYKDSDGPCSRGYVWLHNKIDEDNFKFHDWLEGVRGLSVDEKKDEANRVMTRYISDTTYANQVNSGIAGFFDRYPRIPYCRETAYSSQNPERFNKAVPYIDAISKWFRTLMPERYAYQNAKAKEIDPGFLLGDSVYTTITINKNFQTACHYDAGDLKKGFGNIVALSNGVPYEGGYTVFPKYGVAVDLQPGDICLFDPHELHGNTEITSESGKHERVTVVLYFREKMLNCEEKIVEDLRYQYIEQRRKNKEHRLWKPLWNGVSPGMWEEEEWVDYLLANGMNEYVKENFGSEEEKPTSLEDFFDL